MESYTGQDICEFDGRVLANFADGDVVSITYPNELHGMSAGKNGNAIAAHNEQGNIALLEMRILKGSPDDKFLNSKVLAWQNKLASFTPSTAKFTKVITVDNGITNEVNNINFIIPTAPVETRDNVNGETEQAVAIYRFRGITAGRALA